MARLSFVSPAVPVVLGTLVKEAMSLTLGSARMATSGKMDRVLLEAVSAMTRESAGRAALSSTDPELLKADLAMRAASPAPTPVAGA